MRKEVTISEVSKLLNISIHTIRYYEKEGLILPTSRSDGGYRLFDMETLTQLDTIVLLRECGISVKDIKNLIIDYSEEKHTHILDESYDRVCQEVKKLTLIKKRLNLLRSVRKDYVDGEFKVVDKPRIVITTIEKIDEVLYESPKKLYDFYTKHSAELFADHESTLYFTAIDGHLFFCSKRSGINEQSIEFESGKYLSYFFTGDIGKQDINKEIELINRYIEENVIGTEGYPLITLSPIKSNNEALTLE
jgi:DNA-binding transcriptional MerR regulator